MLTYTHLQNKELWWMHTGRWWLKQSSHLYYTTNRRDLQESSVEALYCVAYSPILLLTLGHTIDNRPPTGLEALYVANTKLYLHPCFALQHCFLALALVPVLENSSNNPSIMFSKFLCKSETHQKLFCSFDVLPYEKSLSNQLVKHG